MDIFSKNKLLAVYFTLNTLGVFGGNKAHSAHTPNKINDIENLEKKNQKNIGWKYILENVDRVYSPESEFKKKLVGDLSKINDFDVIQELYSNITDFRENMAADLGVSQLYAKTPLEKIKITNKKNRSHYFKYGYDEQGDFSYEINMTSNEEKYHTTYVNNGVMSQTLLSQYYVHEVAHALNPKTSKDNYKNLEHQIVKDERHAVADLLREKYSNNREAVKFINVLNMSMDNTQSKPKDQTAYEWRTVNSKTRAEKKEKEQEYLAQLGAIKIDGRLIANDPLFQDFQTLNKKHHECGIQKQKLVKTGHAVHEGIHEDYASDYENKFLLELQAKLQEKGVNYIAVTRGAYSSTEAVVARQIEEPIISLANVEQDPQIMIFGRHLKKHIKRTAEFEDNNRNSNSMYDTETYIPIADEFKESVGKVLNKRVSNLRNKNLSSKNGNVL